MMVIGISIEVYLRSNNYRVSGGKADPPASGRKPSYSEQTWRIKNSRLDFGCPILVKRMYSSLLPLGMAIGPVSVV
jgi:hypothetical protein